MQQDNIFKEIPLSDRILLELDIQGAVSSGTFTVARDLLPKIQALNTIRCILDSKPIYQCNNILNSNLDIFIWVTNIICLLLSNLFSNLQALAGNWRCLNEGDKYVLKTYCVQLIADRENPELLEKLQSNEILHEIVDEKDLKFVEKMSVPVEVPEMLCSSEWDIFEFTNKRNPKLEIKTIEQQIISSYNHQELRELLVKVGTKCSNRSIWKINPKWELPIPLQSVLNSLPKGK